jgi:hypothetical protein
MSWMHFVSEDFCGFPQPLKINSGVSSCLRVCHCVVYIICIHLPSRVKCAWQCYVCDIISWLCCGSTCCYTDCIDLTDIVWCFGSQSVILSNSLRINFVPQCQLIFPCFMGHASVGSESLILFHFSYSFVITRILWNEFKQFFIS